MKKLLKTTTSVLAGLTLSFSVIAAGGGALDHANTDINDQKSLQNGAKLFMNYCSGCHSIAFMRYNRIGKDLGISDADVEKNLMFNGEKIGDKVTSSMSDKGAIQWFGTTPPDLSLVSRSKGVDWVYTYLRSFYKDESRPFGVNNKILVNASMPDVLWELKQNKSAEDFDQDVRDITNFLDYVGEPAKLVRVDLGYKVLAFLFVLFILSYLLKKEYWKDVKYGKWRAKD
ncbi:MAG TPA: ubiquinol-cytochrome C reductase [Gammaproteobacteria bacterium]|jgi:ubiquinol-cytochrome c reductase cytochrome c1 subunit|uniref:Ubiquinol cytochrome C oxidoreductase, cytochrome C1 subunit n=1 Tax=hydrothermal vent metagenome TaxID=652676 RepID=A0A1W1DDW4_9ZZZZ|nr:ubiquinol-cytochrome C reductase [Gammaproteobacteria bacterium]HAE04841.1 ubiquinol-cytochrome C reductase [Gammaproteobacteria bacterium]HAE69993.1 ubiquinol-cytochrome C reductase [Gammaproteobacteria bacterium]HAE73438.1 ubiquinol-cytochrome C reductase [Gammaproteobacteria bacterium]HAG48226.1 ubiquinol-cytochrome C reductase [Gammaproteobacteria bacterium]